MILAVLAVFVVTYALLIFRRIRGRHIPIWASMVVGSGLMVATLSISPIDAFRAIDFRVIGFLFGMLVLTAGFEKSGLIEYIALWILQRSKSIDSLLLGTIIGSGFLSALFVNDTIALLWTPIVLSIGSKIGLTEKKALLIPLAFGITIGSASTPIGNPQNLLVALNSGMKQPFANFMAYLFLPALASLLVTFLLCKSRFFFGRQYSNLAISNTETNLKDPSSAVTDRSLAKLSAALMALLLASFAVVEIFPQLQSWGLSLDTLAFAFGMIFLLLTPRRVVILRGLSWGVLVFFAGMFVVMQAVWQSSVGSTLLGALPSPNGASRVQSTGTIMVAGVLLSQILSNVPMVQLYSLQMVHLGFGAGSIIPWLALAAGSTLAGNLTLLGAVSNVIIVGEAEKRGERSFGFLEFFKYGLVITLVSAGIFFLFLAFA